MYNKLQANHRSLILKRVKDIQANGFPPSARKQTGPMKGNIKVHVNVPSGPEYRLIFQHQGGTHYELIYVGPREGAYGKLALKGPYYHGTNHPFMPGNGVGQVFVSDIAFNALSYAVRKAEEEGGYAYVFEVEPLGDVTADPEQETGWSSDQWVIPVGKILREVPHEEALRGWPGRRGQDLRERLKSVTYEATGRTAATNWRAFVKGDIPFWKQHHFVIATQMRGRQRYYQLWVMGELHQHYPRLDDAKAAVESDFGPQDWEHIQMPKEWAYHYFYGWTTEFTDPTNVYVADL